MYPLWEEKQRVLEARSSFHSLRVKGQATGVSLEYIHFCQASHSDLDINK